MEKRALIAFGLTLLVLVFWQMFLYKAPEQAPREVTQQTIPQPGKEAPPATVKPPTVFTPQDLPKDQLLPQAAAQFESWTVESPLYSARILAPGARVASFKLKQFRETIDAASPPMDVVPGQSTGFIPLAIDLLNHQDWQLSTRAFTTDSPANTVVETEGKKLALTTEVPGKVKVVKTFTFSPDSYVVDLDVKLQNLSPEKLVDQMGMSFYFQPYGGMKEDSYNPSQLAVYDKSLNAYELKEVLKKDFTFKSPLQWVGFENNYFLQALVPLQESGYEVISRPVDADRGLIQMVYLSDAFQMEPNAEKSFKIRLYFGPKNLPSLDKAGHNLQGAVDYGWFTFLAKPMLVALNWLYKYVHNYGWAIIIITVLIKLIFWPLTQKSYESMRKMKKIQPKIQQIREKFKDDKEKLNKELMGVYKTHKVNPMGGCLPMVLQIPVFFALYRMLNAAVDLRHEPFLWWINDLTAPDRLPVGFDIPYLGGLPVLTILMGVSMFFQQKMTPTGGDPRQEQIMLLLPVIFTVFFVNFPSGLVLYWFVNNVLSIAQQYWINRRATS